jgi:hypothetical protein
MKEKMTPEMVKQQIAEIAKLEGIRIFESQPDCTHRFWDDAKAHILEDALYEGVLVAIAEGRCEDPRACAAEALKSSEFDFSRWYS